MTYQPSESGRPGPSNVRIEDDGVYVLWGDGHEGFYPHRFLRSECPCAHCVEEMTGRRMVFFDDIDPEVLALDWIQVGNYALSFLFSDAHDTGIYPFERMQNLCQCNEHRANQEG